MCPRERPFSGGILKTNDLIMGAIGEPQQGSQKSCPTKAPKLSLEKKRPNLIEPNVMTIR